MKVKSELLAEVWSHAYAAARVEDYVYQQINDAVLAQVSDGMMRDLERQKKDGGMKAKAAQIALDQFPISYRLNEITKKLDFFPEKVVYVCTACKSVSEPCGALFPGSMQHAMPKNNWRMEYKDDGHGTVAVYRCPDCMM